MKLTDISFGDIQIVDQAPETLLMLAAQLHEKAFKKLDQKGWSAAQISASLDQPGCHLVLVSVNENIAGFALYKTVLGETELFTLAVDPAYQRAGIASRLLKTIIHRLQEAESVSFFLEVRCDNTSAIACYEKLGFELIATRQHYYTDHAGNKLDASIYRLML